MLERSEAWKDLFSQFSEREALAELDRRIARQESALALCGRLLALRNQPGYDAFIEAIKGIREHAASDLIRTKASNEEMRVAQGQIQAYDNVLAIISKGEDRRIALDKGLTELREQRKLLARPTSKETS